MIPESQKYAKFTEIDLATMGIAAMLHCQAVKLWSG